LSSGITADGEKEEYLNEQATLGDLDIFIPVLKLVERQGNQSEKLLNAEISNLIGRRLHDFDVMGKEVPFLISILFNITQEVAMCVISGIRMLLLRVIYLEV